MREIKFRVWDGGKKRWLGSSWFLDQFGALFEIDSPDGITIPSKYRSSVLHLMQYTGLKDKNGVEIYEGDVVLIRFRDNIVGEPEFSWDKGVIKWNQKSSAFKWFAIDEDPSDENNYWLTSADSIGREVIGNIYENPDLLKGGDE